jgi:hypothetical protein
MAHGDLDQRTQFVALYNPKSSAYQTPRQTRGQRHAPFGFSSQLIKLIKP